MYVLGIDTGGTYTDAALVDAATGAVVRAAKALTTPHDLAVGVAGALRGLTDVPLRQAQGEIWNQVSQVALSTTLATNAIVEGKGGRVCLLLLGYDAELIRTFGFESDLVAEERHIIPGRFDMSGAETEPLDEALLRRIVAERAPFADAFAISGYLSVRNPDHEKRARRIVLELCDLPVVCGHDLSGQLNSIRRATTAALNARLIPLLRDLVLAVRGVLAELGVQAPLMVVKGDGGLMAEQLALERPLETVLSGPAASAIGAHFLGGAPDALVVDVGGTTTDVALLRGGRPAVNAAGARVGKWDTFIRAVDMRTAGLGGDSHLQLVRRGGFTLGPRRAVPLCLAAAHHQEMLAHLKRADALQWWELDELLAPTDYLLLVRRPEGAGLRPEEERMLAALEAGPRPVADLARELDFGYLHLAEPGRLERLGYIQRVGLTPTDLLHVEGGYVAWDCEAARLGVRVFAKRLRLSPEQFTAAVRERVVRGIAEQIVAKIAADEAGVAGLPDSPASTYLVARALDGASASDLHCTFALGKPIVAIGAPVEAYLPEVAQRLHTRLVIPPHAAVANAVGAAAGRVRESVEVLIQAAYDDLGVVAYYVHSPEERREFKALDEATGWAEEVGRRLAREQAERAGARETALEVERKDDEAAVGEGWGSDLYLGSRLVFTAVQVEREE